MQSIGYLLIDGQKILVLFRSKKYAESFSVQLKLRKGGRDGSKLDDESTYLSLKENKGLLHDLLNGKVVEI